MSEWAAWQQDNRIKTWWTGALNESIIESGKLTVQPRRCMQIYRRRGWGSESKRPEWWWSRRFFFFIHTNKKRFWHKYCWIKDSLLFSSCLRLCPLICRRTNFHSFCVSASRRTISLTLDCGAAIHASVLDISHQSSCSLLTLFITAIEIFSMCSLN